MVIKHLFGNENTLGLYNNDQTMGLYDHHDYEHSIPGANLGFFRGPDFHVHPYNHGSFHGFTAHAPLRPPPPLATSPTLRSGPSSLPPP